MNLRGGSRGWQDVLAQGEGPFVIVADDPSPSVAAQVDWSLVRGLAIDGGSRTSHTAILARSLGIPTVVGLGDASMQVTPGEMVALDGEDGVLVIGPDDLELAAMARRQATRTTEQFARALRVPGPRRHATACAFASKPTSIGSRTSPAPLTAGADGVGLFRSESLLLNGTVQGLAGSGQRGAAGGRLRPRDRRLCAGAGDDSHLRHRPRAGRGADVEGADRTRRSSDTGPSACAASGWAWRSRRSLTRSSAPFSASRRRATSGFCCRL